MNPILKHKVFLRIFIFLFCCLICSSKAFNICRDGYICNGENFSYDELNLAAISYVASLSPEDAASQLFLVNVAGCRRFLPVETYYDVYPENEENSIELKQKILAPGGCLLFAYNIADDYMQVMEYIESINEVYSEASLPLPHIAIDQEGGMVNRLKGITSSFPSAKLTAETISPDVAERMYYSQARQMKYLGFSMNLSPVAEPSGPENCDFLLSRSFGNPARTVAFSVAQINAFEKARVCTVVKHFPGNTNVDPHTGLPEIKVSEVLFEQYYLKPFKLVLTTSPGAVLMSHARIAALSGDEPAALSPYWIKEKLKGDFFYDGLVISDDIFMAALTENGFPPEEAAVKAIEAGTDVIMLSEKRFAPALRILLDKAAIDETFKGRLENAERRVILSKIYYGLLEVYRENGQLKVVNKNTLADMDYRFNSFEKEYDKGMELYDRYFN
ncbi:glycoside hydrolase family 3 N-terminal domain-containing protein [Treponema sp.]|uniref:glycoside hydrolase family 3 N-terminal domain-containing protein n=1 Tax=Treponema sp. TaxID=166 RepID=UPI0025EC9F24|nr:glycoside hydrolase family 3 N-terminal domain-containing protein [Treponema sp.]MCR5218240.1 glycoside hydrolase family 3 protein [Treponema sp.]